MWLNALYYRVCDMHQGCARALFGMHARAPAGYNLNPRLNPGWAGTEDMFQICWFIAQLAVGAF